MNHRVKQSIKEATYWLSSTRKTGKWRDLVYKKQGIINTAEAWHALTIAQKLLPNFKLPEDWLQKDSAYISAEIEKNGFQRTPYQPDQQKHQSIDTASFIVLALSSKMEITQKAANWLIANQYTAGGWSWGKMNQQCPMYPYFTYMALAALQKAKENGFAHNAKTAIDKGIQWLLAVQRADGGFPVYDGDDSSDVASTAYALLGTRLALVLKLSRLFGDICQPIIKLRLFA